MLDTQVFKNVLENTPLVSIDLCLVCKGQILLGRRENEPLKNEWFTPGGRIFKNEPWQECMRRVAYVELGLVIDNLPNLTLMGVWDHFYENSVLDENVSTHYVNLPHYCILAEKPNLFMDKQHNNMSWFDLEKVASKNGFHKYMQNYASWLINAGFKYY